MDRTATAPYRDSRAAARDTMYVPAPKPVRRHTFFLIYMNDRERLASGETLYAESRPHRPRRLGPAVNGLRGDPRSVPIGEPSSFSGTTPRYDTRQA